MSCPWDGPAPANLAFCEADLCGWITQPANTWSNVGFFVAGAWVIWLARRDAKPLAGSVGWLAIATGLGSVAFHATSTLAGQLIDQSAMLLESGAFVIVSLASLVAITRPRALALFLVLTVLGVAVLVAIPTAGIALFAAEMIVFAAVELALLRRGPRISYRPLAAVIVLFAISYGAWWIDRLGIVCDPDDHVFGLHALWHLLGAASFPCWYAHFAQRTPLAPS